MAAAADDMECRLLEVTVISARDLEDVRHLFDMNPYVVAFLSTDGRHKQERPTPPHKDGGTNPRWDHTLAPPFTIDVAAARTGGLTLMLEIKTKRTVGSNKDIGRVAVPVGELLKLGGDGESVAMSYAVSPVGVLEFSYKFGEAFTLREAPENEQPKNARGCLRNWLIIGGTIVNVTWGILSDVFDI